MAAAGTSVGAGGPSRVRARPGSRIPAGAAKRMRWRIEAALFDLFAGALAWSTPRTRRAIGSAFGTAFWAVDVRHRRAAVRNIALAYGDRVSAPEVRRLALASMRHYVRMMVEAAALGCGEPAARGTGPRVEGLEHVEAAARKGRGVITFTGHLGCWESWPVALGSQGVPIAVIARPLENPLLAARLVQARTGTGSRVIDKAGAMREALAELRRGGVIGLLIDQRPEKTGEPVPFFGHRAFAAGSLAALALRTGAPVIPGIAVAGPDGSCRLEFEPEVPAVQTGDVRADTARIMADCTAVLERWVRRYPDQYLWTHAKMKP